MVDAATLAEMLTEVIAAANAPLLARIAVLERQKSAEPVKGEPGERGADGRDADMTMVLNLQREIESLRSELAVVKSVPSLPSLLIDESGELVAMQGSQLQKLGRVRGRDAAPVAVDLDALAQKAASLVPRPKDGRDAEPVDIDAIVQKAVGLIPVPKDGVNGKDAPPVDVEAIAKRAAELVPRPSDGKDAVVDLDALARKAVTLIPPAKDGKDGVSVGVDDVLPHVHAAVVKALADLPKPRDGRDVELVTVQALVDAAVVKAVAGLPVPKDGVSVSVDDVEPLIRAEVTKAVGALPKPKDGASVGISDVEPLVRAEVQKAVGALPAPVVAVKAEDVEPIVRTEVAKAVAQIQPREPIGFVGALTDRNGHLVLTRSDGVTLDAGPVVGRDGADVDMERLTKAIEAEVAKIPRPANGQDGKDGANGKDGADGVGFDDMDVVVDEVRKGCFLRFTKGQRVKEFRIDGVPLYCGVYDDSQEYFKGNEVTRGGSTWRMQSDHVKGVKPDDTPESRKVWKLVAMRGKEGRPGLRGPAGPAGKDYTWGDRNG